MRDTGSLLGLTSVPLLIALIAVVPLTSSSRRQRSTTVPLPTRDTTVSIAPRKISHVRDFRMGRDLVGEIRGFAVPADVVDSVRVLVALFPDPDESSLDWMYDAQVAALRRALERAGYLADRMWLPSRADEVTIGEGAQEVSMAAPDALPGVMVFRGGSGRSIRDLVVVLTVGEIPTSGVHRQALRIALAEAKSLSRPQSTIRVLGPTFSGTAPSLRAVLEDEFSHAPCRPVDMISGTATSSAGREMLTFPVRCRDGDTTWTIEVSFHATVHTDDEYARAIADRLLTPLGLEANEVALLTEANTVYGSSLQSSKETLPVGGWQGERPHMLDSALVITFPLNVASVRREYSRNPAAETQERSGPASRLPLTLDFDARPREAPPARSRLTPPALDIVLGDMIATLRAHRIRAVGILASDIRDKLFLAELVRRGLPDVLLFTFEGHALFARRDLAHSLRGMVVVSSYPLMLENGTWTESVGFASFSTEGAAGVFNATMHLLGVPALVQEYRPPLSSRINERVPIWLTAVGTGTLLPLTVIDVGEDDHVPPAIAPVTNRSLPPPGPLDGLTIVAVGLGAALALAGILVISLAFAGLFKDFMAARKIDREAPRRPRLDRSVAAQFKSVSSYPVVPSGWWKASTHEPGPEEGEGSTPGTGPEEEETDSLVEHWNVMDLLALLAAVLAFLAPLALLNDILPGWSDPDFLLMLLGLGMFSELICITVLLGGYVVSQIVERRAKEAEPRWFPVLTDTIAHIVVLALAILSMRYCWDIIGLATTSPVDYGLYRARTLRLDAGISGLIPFLIASVAAVLLLGWHRDRRSLLTRENRRSLERLAKNLGDLEPDVPWHDALRRAGCAMRRIRDRLELRIDVLPLQYGFVFGGVVLMFLTVVIGNVGFQTLESVTLGRWGGATGILWVGLILGFLGLATEVVHLVAVGRAFRTFLHALADTPLAPAFSRIPDRLRTMGRLHLFDPPSDKLGGLLAESGHEAVWAAAMDLEGETLEEVGITPDEARMKVESLRGSDTPAERQASLWRLIQILQVSWTKRPGLVWGAAVGGSAEKPGKEDEHGTWLRTVEDVVAVEVTRYVDWVLRNIRRIAILLLCTILYCTAMLEAMPFLHHSAMTTVFVLFVVVGLLAVLALMAKLGQDDILSRITGTDPGRINWNSGSLVSALVFVAIPVLGLLGTEVAPVGQSLFGWVRELLRLLSTV